jgi:AraC-like DNA-binding protein
MLRPEIQRALSFVASNLDRPITVAEVAQAAHLSEFHLHRVFHTTVGESVGRFITRRRLEHAARMRFSGPWSAAIGGGAC